MELGLCDLHAVSVCVLESPLSNAKTNFYETWYVYHGTLSHLSGIPY
jgi:hypothetical protein